MVNPEFNSILAAALEEQKRWTSGKDDCISRKAVNNFIDAYHDKAEKEYSFCDEVVTDICGDVGQFVDDLPAADVVAVVRCRECIHRPKRLEGYEDGDGFGLEFPDERCPCHCEDGWYSWMPPDDWFCANGERKDRGDGT